jgi:signal transduction histidine kinase
MQNTSLRFSPPHMQQHRPLRTPYLVILTILATLSLFALLTDVTIAPWHGIALVLLGLAYWATGFFSLIIEVPGSDGPRRIPLNPDEVIDVVAVIVVGPLGVLASLISTIVTGVISRYQAARAPTRWRNIVYNCTSAIHAYLVLTVYYDLTRPLFARADIPFSGFWGVIAFVGLMALYPLWDKLYFSLILSTSWGRSLFRPTGDQPPILHGLFASTPWVSAIPVAIGGFISIAYAVDPWLALPVACLAVLSYYALRAWTRLHEVSEQRQSLAEELTHLNATLEARVVAKTREVEATLQQKAEVISIVSHDMRSALTALIAPLAALVDARAAVPTPLQPLLQVAHRNSVYLDRLVRDILDMDRLDAGSMPMDIQPVDVRTFMERAVDFNHAQAAACQVTLRLEVAAAGVVAADADRLLQVVTNLITNACTFAPNDTEVVITAQDAPDGLRIAVRDHGPGVPDAIRDRIFDKFAHARVATGQARAKHGTGLGLAICRAIMRQLGGTITYVPAPGGGSCFTVTVPWYAAAWRPARSANGVTDDRGTHGAAVADDPLRG